jgi:hypothetical protein
MVVEVVAAKLVVRDMAVEDVRIADYLARTGPQGYTVAPPLTMRVIPVMNPASGPALGVHGARRRVYRVNQFGVYLGMRARPTDAPRAVSRRP